MTGHPDSPTQSPGVGPRAAGERMGPSGQEEAMHPQQSPLIHAFQNVGVITESVNCIESDYALPVPMAPVATPVQVQSVSADTNSSSLLQQSPDCANDSLSTDFKNKFETLRSLEQQTTLDMDTHICHQQTRDEIISNDQCATADMQKNNMEGQDSNREEASNIEDGNESSQELSSDGMGHSTMGYSNLNILGNAPKTWTQQDMENALDALRNHNMSLTKASATFGIPSTTLWQRAHRLGIDTPKKEGPSKSWSEGNLHSALQALRTGTISANKASKAFGIPSSTLYKIARREGIRLAAPFNAAPTAWRPGDLERALQSIRSGHSSVQRASTEFGIPTGTLYGRCKREGIELSRSNPTPWSEDAMGEALEAVRVGQMSINQAAIHYNLPYSSLYGRFKRCKYEGDPNGTMEMSQHIQDHNAPHHMLQQPLMSHQGAHIQDHSTVHDTSQHMYSVYHQPIVLPVSLHNPNENHNVSHNNQDCIPTS